MFYFAVNRTGFLKSNIFQAIVFLLLVTFVWNLVGAESSLRSRVLSNIAESSAAREATGFPALTAKITQLSDGYLPDPWGVTSLREGDLVYGSWPGQSVYYTTEESLLNSNLDKEALWRSLQVPPHPDYGYRPLMRVYQVTRDMRVPFSDITANTEFGAGGGQQFFIKNYSRKPHNYYW